MNHHFRSYSEQQQPLQPHQQPSHLINSMNNHNNNNNPVDLPDRGSLNGIIRIHSDSQQSLDRLFNPPINTQPAIPLRNRNLPPSFFNPTWQDEAQPRHNSNSLHSRSTSYDHRRNLASQLHGNVHMRTQSTLAPMTGLMGNASNNNTNTITNTNTNNNNISSVSNEHITNGSNATAPGSQQQLATPANPSQNAQQIQPLPQQRNNNHYRNFSSPAFMNNATTQANHFYSPTQNTPLSSQNVNVKPQVQIITTNNYYNMATVSPDTNMTTSNYAQPPATSYQPSVPHDYYTSGSTSDLPSATQINPCAHQASTYFASNDSIQQQFHITHSQPYIPYDPTLSTSSGLLNPPSQTASSSSSNENNSLLCIPTPAVHSRSCSFDERPSQPVTHARSQSTIVGMTNTGGFGNGSFNNNSNFPRNQLVMGGIKNEQSHPIGPTNVNYNQVTLSPITDQGSVFDEWNEILM